jgi:hypothetical protein
VTRNELEQAPKLIAFVQERLIGGVGDGIYVSGIEDDFVRTFDVVREGDLYKDPDTSETLGYEAQFIGTAELVRPGDPARLTLVATNREVQPDDRLLPSPEHETLTSFTPRPAPPFLDGRIIKVLDGVTQIGQFNVLVINRGSDDGLEPGSVLQVVQRADPPRGLTRASPWLARPELPLEEVGTLMVFRTFDRISYGLVMYATAPIHLRDSLRSPES